MSCHGRRREIQRVFDLVSALIGREQGLTLAEIQELLGVSYRTAIRYMHYAEAAGLVDWTHGLKARQ